MFILGDSIVKNVNGYLLTKKLRNRELIKVRSLSEAKINCMYDHVKPSSREFYPYHLMLHVRTNELKSSKTTSQISKLFIDLALSLKLETKAVTISLVVPRKDSLNNKYLQTCAINAILLLLTTLTQLTMKGIRTKENLI